MILVEALETLKMLNVPFLALFDLHLKEKTINHPDLFGLKDFSPSELMANDYELVGDPSDFHLYEKTYTARYNHRVLHIVFKRYFCSDRDKGSGISIAPGVRLTSLLRRYTRSQGINPTTPLSLEFYFSEDKKEGALILDDSNVIRFNQLDNRGSYMAATLESDHDGVKITTHSVRTTMDHFTFESMREALRKRDVSTALHRLAEYYFKHLTPSNPT
ncbi:hypothetical protein [Pseudomonas purpurea]|uniref:hypothetical protein n=1 Tax=Pseudomonas purpurea TaxID=3136737 RepID=UPI0032649540